MRNNEWPTMKIQFLDNNENGRKRMTKKDFGCVIQIILSYCCYFWGYGFAGCQYPSPRNEMFF